MWLLIYLGEKADMKELYQLHIEENNKKLVIFGTGIHAKETFLELLNQGVKADYFADQNEDLAGLKIYGTPILKEDLKELECNIIIASRAWEAIEQRLIKEGKTLIYVDKKRYWKNRVEL